MLNKMAADGASGKKIGFMDMQTIIDASAGDIMDRLWQKWFWKRTM